MRISNQQLSVNQANKTAELKQFDGGAREFLKSVAADLVNTNGSVKSGYLRLNAGKTEVSINHGHVGSGATAATRLMLNLVNEAYGEQASQALKNYLASTSGKGGAVGKIGTQSFVALIKKMEEGASDNSDGDKNSVNNKIASAEVRNHRLNTTGLVATDERLQILNKTDLFSGVTQDSIKQAYQSLFQGYKPPQIDSIRLLGNQQDNFQAQQNVPPAAPQIQLEQPEHHLPEVAQLQSAIVEPAILEPAIPVEVKPVSAPVSEPIRYETKQFADALSKGQYTYAARLMNAREPSLTPTEMAQELVQEHYGGKALSTRLVQFAAAAFNGDHRIQEVAEFLLAAHGLPDEVPGDVDAMVKPLVDSVLLWQASGQTDVDALGAAIAQKLEARFPNAESIKNKANELSALRLADRLDFDQLGESISDAEDQNATKQEVRDQIAERLTRNGYLAVSARDKSISTPALNLLASGQKDQKRPQMRSLLAGCVIPAEYIRRAENSFLNNPFDGNFDKASLRNCVIRGGAQRAKFTGTDLTGSELTFVPHHYSNFNMTAVNFKGAILENAEIRIDYSEMEADAANNKRLLTGRVVDFMNHFTTGTGQGPLTAIESIDDRYGSMKVKLMREAIEFIEKHGATESLSAPLFDVLSRNPIYSKDPVIRQFMTPYVDRLMKESLIDIRKFALLTNILDGEAPPIRADFVRENMEGVNSLLHDFERNPQIATEPGVSRFIDALRAERDALPELVPLKALLDKLEMVYVRADGVTSEMPWYFMLAPDGAIAALHSEHYNSVRTGDPSAKLIENTMFFVPDSQKYGNASVDYYAVGDSSHVMLANGNIKDHALGLINRFAPLKAHYETNRPIPSSKIAANLFASEPVVSGWFENAFKGISFKLNFEQIQQLGEAFRSNAPAYFEDFSTITNPLKWPDTRLSENFMTTLRELGKDLAGVPAGDERAFAHFLFSLSATFTRLSSEKVFGDGANSIAELRYLGYALNKTAREIEPSILDTQMWTDIENRFLRLHNAMDCAEILSTKQFEASKAIDLEQYSAFTPGVFKIKN